MNAIRLGLLASVMALGVAQAQTTSTPPAATAPTMPMATPPAGTTVPGTMPSTGTATPAPGTMSGNPAATGAANAPRPGATTPGIVNRNTGTAAASGNSNQAVATTTANAPTPATGSNSFTMGEARRRLERRGYSQVSGLAKDSNGVWRGRGMKDGAQVGVWLDYKGNVGQQ